MTWWLVSLSVHLVSIKRWTRALVILDEEMLNMRPISTVRNALEGE